MGRARFWDRLVLPLAAASARRALNQLLQSAHCAVAAQQRLLADHLRRHAPSDFGRRFGFDRIARYADFAARVPISRYEDLAPYVRRLLHGERQALLGPRQRLRMFALTSGTTAEPKYIPVTGEFLASYRRGWNAWGYRAMSDHPGAFLRGIVQVTSPLRDHDAPCGVPCGAITGLLAASQKRLVRRYYVAPLAVADIHDAEAKYYTIMRLTAPRDVSMMVTANPLTLLTLARTADAWKETLLRDVHDGSLTDRLPIPGPVRRALRPRLAPDPAAARRLSALAERHDALRPLHYWNLSLLAHWTGGTMGLYRPYFPPWFGETPVRDIGLLASEGRMSVPLADGTAAGLLDVTSQFFEFIPAEEYGRPGSTVLRCHEVLPGREYFLLLTNAAGLTRYDIGDRVRVVGMQGEAPLIEFLSKADHIASLAGEKLTEHQVVEALQRVAASTGAALAGAVVVPVFSDLPRYRVHVDADAVGPALRSCPQPLAACLDAVLADLNIEYAAKRASRRLDAVEVHITPPGFLAERSRARRAASTARSEQFKHKYLETVPGCDSLWPQDPAAQTPPAPAIDAAGHPAAAIS